MKFATTPTDYPTIYEAQQTSWIVGTYLQLINSRSAAVFCVHLKHAEHAAAQFLEAGIPAEVLHAGLPLAARAEIHARVAAGTTKVICGAQSLAQERMGVQVDAVMVLRPTHSASVHAHHFSLARGPHAALIDFVANTGRLGIPESFEGRVFTVPIESNPRLPKLIQPAEANVQELTAALQEYEAFFDQVFAQACSNGLFDAWGRPINCTRLNEAHRLASKALQK